MPDLEALSKTAMAAMQDYMEAVARRAELANQLREADNAATEAGNRLREADRECQKYHALWDGALAKVQQAAGWPPLKTRGEAQ